MARADTTPCTAASAIRAGMLVKLVTAGTIAPLGVADSVALLFGVALNDAFTGYIVDVQTDVGSSVAFYTDGTGAVSAGDALGPSTTVAGAVVGGSASPVARAMRGAPAELGSPVLGMLSGPGAGGGSNPLAGIFTVGVTAGLIDDITGVLNRVRLLNSAGDGLYADAGGPQVSINVSGNPRTYTTATYFCPATDLAYLLGTPAFRWKAVYACEYALSGSGGLAASSVTINPDGIELYDLALGATAISSLTLDAPTSNVARCMKIFVRQDATGSRTIPTSWTNVKFAGGSYVATPGANKMDVLDLIWDAADGFWREVSRAMNIPK